MSLNVTDILDHVTASLPDFGKFKFTDIMSRYQETIAFKRLFRQKKTDFTSGTYFKFNLMYDTNGSSRSVGLYFTAVVDVPNVLTRGQVDMKRKTFNWAFDIEEIAINSGESMVLDINKTRRVPAFGDHIIDCERGLWATPDSGAVDDFYSIPYWVVKSNTAFTLANEGFNGGLPSGFSTVANIDPTAANITPKWNNYAEQYTSVTKDDLIRKMRRAMKYTHFTPLVDDVPSYELGEDYGCYTTEPVVTTMEEILESQNENLGTNIASMDGKVMFGRGPVSWVKELNNDTTNPVYILNWGVLRVIRRRGFWLKEIPVPVNPNQPTVAVVHIISSFNTLCYDRRRLAVLATDTTMP